MFFPEIIIKTDETELKVINFKELDNAKETFFDEGEHLSTFYLLKENIFVPYSKEANEINILNWFEEKGYDMSKYYRDKREPNSMTSDKIQAIVGKEEMKFLSIDESYDVSDLVLISLQDPDDKDDLSIYHKKFKKVLPMRFWDVEDDLKIVSGGFPVKPLSDEQAKEIAEFIKENKDEKFFIHCAAGQSRSAGVGLAVECILNHNGNKYDYGQFPSAIKNHWRYSPNMVVYDKIVENYTPIEYKHKCDKCSSTFNNPIKGLKEGKDIISCPFCFNQL